MTKAEALVALESLKEVVGNHPSATGKLNALIEFVTQTVEKVNEPLIAPELHPVEEEATLEATADVSAPVEEKAEEDAEGEGEDPEGLSEQEEAEEGEKVEAHGSKGKTKKRGRPKKR